MNYWNYMQKNSRMLLHTTKRSSLICSSLSAQIIFCGTSRSFEGKKFLYFIYSEDSNLFPLTKKNLQDEYSTNKPQLNCFINEDYLIQLDEDEPNSIFVCHLLRFNTQRQAKMVVKLINNSRRRYKRLKKDIRLLCWRKDV